MNTWKKLLIVVVGLGFYGAATSSAEAQVRIYKVTFTAKARAFPKFVPALNGRSFRHSGYIIYAPPSIGGPAAQTVEVFKNKTYQVNGSMLGSITPQIVALTPIDRNNNGVPETEFGFAGGNGMARSYMGKYPANGFRFGNVVFLQTARVLYGRGSVIGADHWTVTDKWIMNTQSGAAPANTAAGVTLVTAFLAGKGFVSVP